MSANKNLYFPVFINLSEKKVIVVGAGTIAKRRIRTLLEFTNHLYVVAPEINNELLNLEKDGQITILRKHYEETDIYDADLVIAATSNAQTNNDIYAICKTRNIFVNVCSDKTKCDFYFPGIARKDNIIVGVTASGTNHKKVKEVVERIRKIL